MVFLKKMMNIFIGDLYSMFVVLQGIGSLPCIRVYIIYVISFGEWQPWMSEVPKLERVWGSYSLEGVACLGRMILTVSPGLRPQSVGSGWSHDFLHLSFICLPLVSHSGSGWSHDFLHLSPICLSFVFHLSPTLGPAGRMISFTCLPFVFHLSSTCLPLWVRLVA